MLDLSYKINDPTTILGLQDETFDFVVDYDFDKIDGFLKKKDYYNKEFGNGQELPVVCGKRVLMNHIYEVSEPKKGQRNKDQKINSQQK